MPGVSGPPPAPLVTRGALGLGLGPARRARGPEKFYLPPRPGAPAAAHFTARRGAGPPGPAGAAGGDGGEERRGEFRSPAREGASEEGRRGGGAGEVGD